MGHDGVMWADNGSHWCANDAFQVRLLPRSGFVLIEEMRADLMN